MERHFSTKHAAFKGKYPVGDAWKIAVQELKNNQNTATCMFNNWRQSASNVNTANFIISQEIAKRGKSYTDGEFIRTASWMHPKSYFGNLRIKKI